MVSGGGLRWDGVMMLGRIILYENLTIEKDFGER